MAVSLLKIHQIFMLTFAGLRVEGKVAQVLVVSQPPPLAFLVFLLSAWWEACATSAAVGGGAPGPVPQERGTGRGRLPPHTAALEVTRPEPWNDRRNTRKTFSFPNETSIRQQLQCINIKHTFLGKVLGVRRTDFSSRVSWSILPSRQVVLAR